MKKYIYTNDLTKEMKEEAIALASNMRSLVEENILKEPDDNIVRQVQALCEKIEAMGVHVSIKYSLIVGDNNISQPDVNVTLSCLKDPSNDTIH